MIYLDNNATTAVAPEVREAMLPWLGEWYGNPSAGYRFGKQARQAINLAREQVAALIEADPEEIVFTSGGTESNHTFLHSAFAVSADRSNLLTSSVEHSAIHEVAQTVATRFSPVDPLGHLDLAVWRDHLADDTIALASLIWANNETGVLSPVAAAAELAAERGVPFHSDAVQAVGKVPVSVRSIPVQSLSLSAHKFHGPKGIGALFLQRHTRFRPTFLGGGQESERRSGTENVAGIVGLGVAAEMARERLARCADQTRLRDDFEAGLLAQIPDLQRNGDPDLRLPQTSNLYFPGIEGEGLLILLDHAGICCSPGSACSTGSVQPSRVLLAMGQSKERARGSVRFSLSHRTTAAEVEAAVAAIVTAVHKLRVVLPSGSGRVVGGIRTPQSSL
jgi:cysteine desulfurase